MVPYRAGGAFTPNTDVLSVSGYAAWMIDEALGATTPLPPLGAAFLRAEREEGINARTSSPTRCSRAAGAGRRSLV